MARTRVVRVATRSARPPCRRTAERAVSVAIDVSSHGASGQVWRHAGQYVPQ